MPTYSQPDYRIPQTDPRVGVQIENALNPLVIVAPITKFTQAGTNAPAAPVTGQLDGTALGRSRNTYPDGHNSST